MSSYVICDSSAVTALLLDSGPDGQWVSAFVSDAELGGPTVLGYETANIVRRHELAGLITPDQAAQAHGDLLDLAIEYWPFELLARRAWQLRKNLSIYDGCYVALAELTGAPLATLDRRIGRAPGLRCAVATP